MPKTTTSACRISIRTDGSVVISDLWNRLGLSQASEPLHLKTVPTQDFQNPLGILDYGLLHGEEPEISGLRGAGAIYIHGCALRCSTCYQPEFFATPAPMFTHHESLANLMLQYQSRCAHSILIVIATYAEEVYAAVKRARQLGLSIPVVYKYSGMIAESHLAKLKDLVDVFVPDLKAISDGLILRHGLPRHYANVSLPSLRRLMRSGARVIVRHLLVPDYIDAAVEVEHILTALPFAETNSALSLLTHFYDPQTSRIQTFPHDKLVTLECRARELGIELIFLGKDSYVPHRS